MTPTPKFWMVWKLGSNGPTVRHPTFGDACEEAERLAKATIGYRFIVLEATAEFEATARVETRNIP